MSRDWLPDALGIAPSKAEPRLLITGSDGSLGKALMTLAPQHGWTPVGMTMHETEALYGADAPEFTTEPCAAIINCHGRNLLAPFGKLPVIGMKRVLLANVLAPALVIDAAVRAGWKEVRVLNIASQTYRVAQRMTSIYCASKAALVQLTKVAARELAEKGWVVNALAPGKIEDTLMSRLTDAQVQELRRWTPGDAERYALSLIPARRFTTRQEVATAALRILRLPKYINGAVIDMTGGV